MFNLQSNVQSKDLKFPPKIFGKSSVLEYLSGVRFVTGQDMVTRCPLQLRMRNIGNREESVAIVKSAQTEPIEIPNPESEEGAKQLEEAIEKITKLHVGQNVVSNELIEVEVRSPHVPDLTLVDLPGLITHSTKENPHLADLIKDLVKKNMTEKDCILIVGDGGRDLQTIVGFKEAEEVDFEQKRTLCVLTKVDKCIHDKEIREKLIKSINNQGSIKLLHGFVALKNRTSSEKHLSIEDCEKIESALLEKLDAPDSNKGRSALIEKLTQIQNNHLQESIPKQRELLESELVKIDYDIENFSDSVKKYCEFGDEALITRYEEIVEDINFSFKDFSENKENFDTSNVEDLLESINSNPLSLSEFTSVIDDMWKELSYTEQTSFERVEKCYNIVIKFIEKTKGFPGLPDLYQPTILLDLVKLEINSMKQAVKVSAAEALKRIEAVLIENLIPKFVNNIGLSKSKLEKMLKSEMKRNLSDSFNLISESIEILLNREAQRTFTFDGSYVVKTNQLNQLYQILKGPTSQQQQAQEKALREIFTMMGLPNLSLFAQHLTSLNPDRKIEILRHNAAIEILIKYRSYMGIVLKRVADQIALLLYDGLVVFPCKEMKKWLHVNRPNKTQSILGNSSSVKDLPGIPVNRIIEIMKPTNSEVLALKRLLDKKEAIKKAIEIIKKLDWEL